MRFLNIHTVYSFYYLYIFVFKQVLQEQPLYTVLGTEYISIAIPYVQPLVTQD